MIHCCVCNAAIADDLYFMPDEAHPSFVFCDDCYRSFHKLTSMPSEEEYLRIQRKFSDFVINQNVPASVRDTYRDADDICRKNMEAEDKYDAAYRSAVENLLLTTGSLLEGYKVVKYLDIISSEILFKSSLLMPLSSSIADILNYFRFEESEMAQTMDLIDIIKSHVMDKFRKKAVEIGANGVVGVSFDTAFGSDFVKISVSGTAVVVAKTA